MRKDAAPKTEAEREYDALVEVADVMRRHAILLSVGSPWQTTFVSLAAKLDRSLGRPHLALAEASTEVHLPAPRQATEPRRPFSIVREP